MSNQELSNQPQSGKKKRIWMALFVLINIAVVAITAINEFSGKPADAVMPKFTGKAWLYLGCTALCLVVLLFAESAGDNEL